MTPSILVWKLICSSQCVVWEPWGSQRPFQGDHKVKTIFTVLIFAAMMQMAVVVKTASALA